MTKGFRRPAILRFWDKFDVVLAFLLDIMHQFDEGVVRWIIAQIITVDGNSGTTRAQLNVIERLWMSVAVPGHQNRNVRSLDDYKSWKAHELKFFIQHAAPFVLKGNCSEGFYFLVCLLSRIGWLATHDEITHESLKEIESRCTRYVKTFQDYFGIEQMKYFIHLMLHSPLAIERFGPLHPSSCYRPENEIGRVTRKICNHTKNIMDSFLKLQECTARMEDMLSFGNSKIVTTAKRLMGVPASPYVIKGAAGTCRLSGQSNVIEDGEAYAEVRREGRRRKECWSRDRVHCFRKAAAEVGIVVRTKKHSQSQQKNAQKKGKTEGKEASVASECDQKADRKHQEYYVEKVLDRRQLTSVLGSPWEYFGKWDGYPDSQNSWIQLSASGTDRHLPEEFDAVMECEKKPVKNRVRERRDWERMAFAEACGVIRNALEVVPGSRLLAKSLVTYYAEQLKEPLTTDNRKSFEKTVGKALGLEFPDHKNTFKLGPRMETQNSSTPFLPKTLKEKIDLTTVRRTDVLRLVTLLLVRQQGSIKPRPKKIVRGKEVNNFRLQQQSLAS
ncbi:hypothetical protein RvY_02393 [Ramazzottius varieornatus]|uniref:Chromo domain-containing protein n=1 Tax=Ramazzottius varieornatus TaxID=947166 RepID=A0A1D1UUP7_RAMVA|nr:hypothetical protein RvY_02393 [Ramazzottius varieornatus]